MFNTELYLKAVEKISHRYLLTNLVAMRTRQLVDGAEPLVDDADGMDYMDLALREIAEGVIEPKKEEQAATSEDLFG